ncbi:MAG: sulfurtransferase-like selenium metabolism protein YedF [Rubrobacteridae bacterium]|nr:sulfurtransferase-like selenium metabolism protein YedF [Rubrobacteridae bacterium]
MSLKDERMYVISGKAFGSGSDDLGQKLMANFLLTLASVEHTATTIFLLNGAVELAVEGSSCIDELETLEKSGCEILLCTTCAEFYGLSSKIKVGKASNMKTLVEKMNTTGKVIMV